MEEDLNQQQNDQENQDQSNQDQQDQIQKKKSSKNINRIGQVKVMAKKLKNKKKSQDDLISEFLNKDNEPVSPNHNEKEETIKKKLEKKFTTILKIRKQITSKQNMLNKANISGKSAVIQKQENDDNNENKKKLGFFEKKAKNMRLGSFLEGFGLNNGEDFDFNKATDISILTSTLDKPMQERTERQVNILSEAIKQTEFYSFYEDIFQKYHEVYKKVLSHMHFESFSKYQYVMHQGHNCRFIYIILSGSCVELIPDVSISQEQLDRDLEKFHNLANFSSERQGNELDQIGQNLEKQSFKTYEQYLEAINPGFKVFRKLKKTQYFGDTFVRFRTITKFTVQCIQNMNVAILPLEKYHHFIDITQSLKYQKEHGFFQECGILKNFEEFDIEIMYRHCERRELKLGNVIYKQGDSPLAVYIIVSGEIEIASLINIETEKTYDNTKHFLQQVYIEERNKQLFKQNKQLKGKINSRRTIALLGIGQSFGEDELLQNNPRQQEAVCKSSNAVVLVIDRNLYINLLSSSTLTRIYNKKNDFKLSDKQIWRNKLVQQIVKVETQIQQNQVSQKDIHKNEEYKQEIIDMIEDQSIKMINQSNNANILSSKSIQNKLSQKKKIDENNQKKKIPDIKLPKNPKYNNVKSKFSVDFNNNPYNSIISQYSTRKSEQQLENQNQQQIQQQQQKQESLQLIKPKNEQYYSKTDTNFQQKSKQNQQQNITDQQQNSISQLEENQNNKINITGTKQKRISCISLDKKKISMTKNGQASVYSQNYGKNNEVYNNPYDVQSQYIQQITNQNQKQQQITTPSQNGNNNAIDTNTTIQNMSITQHNLFSPRGSQAEINTPNFKQQYAQTARLSLQPNQLQNKMFNFKQNTTTHRQSQEILLDQNQGFKTQRNKNSIVSFSNLEENNQKQFQNKIENFSEYSQFPQINNSNTKNNSNKNHENLSEIKETSKSYNYFDKYNTPKNNDIINGSLQDIAAITKIYQLQNTESKIQLSKKEQEQLQLEAKLLNEQQETPKLSLKEKRAIMEAQNNNIKLIPIDNDEKVFNEHTQKYLNQLDMKENKCKRGQTKFKPFLNYENLKSNYTYITTEHHTDNYSSQEIYNHQPQQKIQFAKGSSSKNINIPLTQRQSENNIADIDKPYQSLTSRNVKNKDSQIPLDLLGPQHQKDQELSKRKVISNNDFNKLILYQSLNLQKILPQTTQGKETKQFNKKLSSQLVEQHKLLAQEADIKSRKQKLPGHIINKMKPGQQPLKLEDYEKDIPNSKSFTSKEKYIFCQYLDKDEKCQKNEKEEFANFIIPKKKEKSPIKSYYSGSKSPSNKRRFGLSSSTSFNFKRQVSLYNSSTNIKDKDGSPMKGDKKIVLESRFDDLTPRANSLVSQINISQGSQITYKHQQSNKTMPKKKSNFVKSNTNQSQQKHQTSLQIKSSNSSLHKL